MAVLVSQQFSLQAFSCPVVIPGTHLAVRPAICEIGPIWRELSKKEAKELKLLISGK